MYLIFPNYLAALRWALLYENQMAEPLRSFLRQGGKEVEKVVTPSGVVGLIATCLPAAGLMGLADKLRARELARNEGRLIETPEGELVISRTPAGTPSAPK